MQKRDLSTIVTTLIIILLVFVAIGIVWITKEDNKSVITRSFSSTTVSPGGTIDVTLSVVILGGEEAYAIEEYIPSGWTWISGNAGQPTNNVYKWIWVFNSSFPLDQRYDPFTYTVQAPSSTGDYTFSGTYAFEGFASPVDTKGQTTVTVK